MTLQKQKRIVCVWFPNWPVQRLLSIKPELARTVLLLTENTGRGEHVAFCNRWAFRRSIRVGMPLAEAQSLISRRDAVHVQPIQSGADRLAIEELAIGCELFSPCVGLEDADRPSSILLDITGIGHLFGGEVLLAGHLQNTILKRGFEVRTAVGDSVAVAWAAAHFLADEARPIIIPSGRFESLWELPIEGLRLSQSSVGKLHWLAVRTIRQLLGLPRSSLPSRFGGDVNLRLAQFLGERPEPIVPCRPQPKFEVEQFFEDGLKQTEMIERWSLTLIERLTVLLKDLQMGTRCLQCTFVTERKSQQNLTIRLCQPTSDARHLGDLLRLNMERLRFEASLVGIRIEAFDNCRFEPPQQEMFDGPSRNLDRQLSLLLNRLSSRLGPQAVVRSRLLPEAVPERAFEYVSVTNHFPATATEMKPSLLPFDRPTCLFSQPRLVEVIAVTPNGPPSVLFTDQDRFDIAQHDGPERIESSWWQDGYVRRDYYRVVTTEGRQFWLFRRLQDGQWFLHGGSL